MTHFPKIAHCNLGRWQELLHFEFIQAGYKPQLCYSCLSELGQALRLTPYF